MVQPIGPRRLLATALFLAAALGVSPARGGPIFQAEVKVDGTLLGTFAIDAYEEASANEHSFGVAIRGGFNPAATGALPPGYSYRWVQTVTSTTPAHAWQTPGETYVDRLRDLDAAGDFTLAQSGSPFYGGGIVGPNEDFELPFADSPSRETTLDEFQGTWALSLVAVEDRTTPGDFNQPDPGATRAIHQLATFVWGFDAAKRPDGSYAIVLPTILAIAADPAALAAAFARDPDRETFGGGAWSIRSGLPGSAPGVVPEPSSMLMALSAGLAIGVPVHRARRRAS